MLTDRRETTLMHAIISSGDARAPRRCARECIQARRHVKLSLPPPTHTPAAAHAFPLTERYQIETIHAHGVYYYLPPSLQSLFSLMPLKIVVGGWQVGGGGWG